VELVFTADALEATARLAIDRKTGARALRTIVEEALLEVMYDIPERADVRKCIITEETIRSGRLPVIVTLSALTAEDLVRVLTEPKNAVTRQFQKFLGLDKVELVFTSSALVAAADVALERKTGARALRSIVEEALLEVMYDIPERSDVRKCIITEETIREGRLPLLLTKTEVDKGVDETNYAEWLTERGETA
jgi:ATP-dependent protease Clp ATPase subunit